MWSIHSILLYVQMFQNWCLMRGSLIVEDIEEPNNIPTRLDYSFEIQVFCHASLYFSREISRQSFPVFPFFLFFDIFISHRTQDTLYVMYKSKFVLEISCLIHEIPPNLVHSYHWYLRIDKIIPAYLQSDISDIIEI